MTQCDLREIALEKEMGTMTAGLLPGVIHNMK